MTSKATRKCPRCGGDHTGTVCPPVAASPTMPMQMPTTGPAAAPKESEGETIHDLQPDDPVGEYRVVGILGRGGFGVVYEAIQPVIGKRVAIKVLNLRYSTDPVFVNRFTAEARAVNQIRHRHIIDIFSFGQLPDGRQYYVMELLHGQTLSKYLNARGKLAPAEALPILEAIAKALDAAHSQQIAHRDLKPDNVFIVLDPALDPAADDGKPFPKLLDFGIAKLLARSQSERVHPTITGGLVGTPPYMSPEQCKGEQVDHRTDVYSLGVIAYDALAGRLPFDGKSDVEVMWKHIAEPPPPPSTVADVSPALDAPILAMLEKEPFKRPDSAGEAIRRLAEAIGDDAARPSTERRAARPTTPTPVPRRPDAGTAPTLAGTPVSTPISAAVVPVVVPAATPRRRWLVPVLLGGLAAAAVVAGVLARGGGHVVEGRGPPPAADAAPRVAASPSDAAPRVAAIDAGAPATVSIQIEGTPPDTEVRVGGGIVGQAPGTIMLPRGAEAVELTFSKGGYATLKTRVTPEADAKLTITLRKAHKTRPQSEIPPW